MTKRKPGDNDTQTDPPKKLLRISIPTAIPSPDPYSPSSLFSTISSALSAASIFHDISPTQAKPALLAAPPIPGFYFTPSLELPEDLADSVFNFCLSTYFSDPLINQIMLFTRFSPNATTPATAINGTNSSPSSASSQSTSSHLPPILNDLLTTLSTLLEPHIPSSTHSLLFPTTPTRARQVILNLYNPGEGISPHVDLLKRFGDGIIGVSLGSGCVMQFARAPDSSPSSSIPGYGTSDDFGPEESLSNEKGDDRYDLYLPSRSILVLSSDARYKWTHGIEKRKSDFVSHAAPCSEIEDITPCNVNSKGWWIKRGVRLSLTFRWLLPGADVVGWEE